MDMEMMDTAGAVGDAMGALREIAKSNSENAETRVQAAKAILDFTVSLMSLYESMGMMDDEDEFEED